MSDNRGRANLDRAAERIRRIFGSEAARRRLEQEEIERLRASGWRPTRPVPMPAPEGGYGVAGAAEAIARQMDHESAYLAEARRRLAQRQQLAEALPAGLRPIPPRKPAAPRHKSRSRNNELVAGWGDSFDRTQWRPVGRVDDKHRTQAFEAGNRIAIEASSTAYPPTNQYRFTVHAQPLEANGDPQASLSTGGWLEPVQYSSGPTGAGSPNAFVVEATSPAPRQRWTVSIPPQQAAHGNAAYNMLRIYIPLEE